MAYKYDKRMNRALCGHMWISNKAHLTWWISSIPWPSFHNIKTIWEGFEDTFLRFLWWCILHWFIRQRRRCEVKSIAFPKGLLAEGDPGFWKVMVVDLDVDFGMRVKVCFPLIFNYQLAFGFCYWKDRHWYLSKIFNGQTTNLELTKNKSIISIRETIFKNFSGNS